MNTIKKKETKYLIVEKSYLNIDFFDTQINTYEKRMARVVERYNK